MILSEDEEREHKPSNAHDCWKIKGRGCKAVMKRAQFCGILILVKTSATRHR